LLPGSVQRRYQEPDSSRSLPGPAPGRSRQTQGLEKTQPSRRSGLQARYSYNHWNSPVRYRNPPATIVENTLFAGSRATANFWNVKDSVLVCNRSKYSTRERNGKRMEITTSRWEEIPAIPWQTPLTGLPPFFGKNELELNAKVAKRQFFPIFTAKSGLGEATHLGKVTGWQPPPPNKSGGGCRSWPQRCVLPRLDAISKKGGE